MPALRGNSAVLNNQKLMPLLGLGCWLAPPGEVTGAVEAALDCGYRHIDTAYNYLNEAAVGAGIHNWLKKTGNKRDDVFVVTKLPLIAMRPDGVGKYLKKSLALLKLDYVDLYLVHSPLGLKEPKDDQDTFPKDKDGELMVDFATDLIAVWKEMEKMVDAGLTRTIGVSNFNIKQLRKMLAIARIPPAVQQIEMHAYAQQREVKKFCDDNNIVVTAYAPLGSPGRSSVETLKEATIARVLDDPVVNLVATNHKVSAAQVLLRFLIQQGVVVIPKSTNPGRIATNGKVLDWQLTDVEMQALLSLDKGTAGLTFTTFGKTKFALHPEFPVA